MSYVIDADPQRAAAGARRLGAAAWGDDAGTVMRRADVDALVVASPPAGRAALAQAALDRGLHVWLEAPLALRYPDAQRVLAYARASRAVLAVDFWPRAAPGVRLIHARIPRPTFVQIEAVIDPLHESRIGTAAHGGLLGLLGGHAFDLACFLMHSQPVSVQALGGRHTRRSDLADTAAAGIRFANGGLARVIVGEYGRSRACSAWRVLATDGVVTATARRNLQHGAAHVGGRSDAVPPSEGSDPGARHERSLRAFVDAAAGNGRPLAGVEDGVRAVQLADAVYEAMRARRRIPLEAAPLQVRVGPVYADDAVANRRDDRFRP